MTTFSQPDRSMKTTDTISAADILAGARKFRVAYGFNPYNPTKFEVWVVYCDKNGKETYLFSKVVEQEKTAAIMAHKAAEALAEAAKVLGDIFQD